VDTRDLDAIVALFVEDVDCGRRGCGRAVLRQQYDAMTGYRQRSIHQIVGHSFDLIDADHASGIVYCRAEQEQAGGWAAAAIAYFDRYEQRDGAWYFADRNLAFWYGANAFDQPKGTLPRPPVAGACPDPDMKDAPFPSWAQFWAPRGEALVASLRSHD
jgi:hypothetical protein